MEQRAVPLAAEMLNAVGAVRDGVASASCASTGSAVENAQAAGWGAPVMGAVKGGRYRGVLMPLYVAAPPRRLACAQAPAPAGRTLGA